MTLGFDKSYFAYIPTIANLKLSPGGIPGLVVHAKDMAHIEQSGHTWRQIDEIKDPTGATRIKFIEITAPQKGPDR